MLQRFIAPVKFATPQINIKKGLTGQAPIPAKIFNREFPRYRRLQRKFTGQADFHGSTQIHLRDRFRSNKKISALPAVVTHSERLWRGKPGRNVAFQKTGVGLAAGIGGTLIDRKQNEIDFLSS